MSHGPAWLCHIALHCLAQPLWRPFDASLFLQRQDWRLYIVQELCDGGPLRELVHAGGTHVASAPSMVRACLLTPRAHQPLTLTVYAHSTIQLNLI